MGGKTNHLMGFLCLLILLLTATTTKAGPRDSLWNQVDEAIEKGLPQTAITVLDQIIPKAMADQAHAEATKAICLKIALKGQIQGGKFEEMIVLLQVEIDQAPALMKSVMEVVLAHWYWEYFQQNRWRIIQRTQIAEPSGADLATWDLSRILTEIDLHFTFALSADQQLKAIPIEEYDDLLEKGTAPDAGQGPGRHSGTEKGRRDHPQIRAAASPSIPSTPHGAGKRKETDRSGAP